MKILMVIANRDFRDEEYEIPYNYFLEKDIVVDVASTEKGDCVGMFGLQAVADRALSDVEVPEYFAIVFVGGKGARDLVGNKEILRILEEAKKQKIVVSAICIAPMILAQAGLLEGKKATVWDEDSNQRPILEQEGATFVDGDVVTDGLIVTANGPKSARPFAEEVLRVAECEDCWKSPDKVQ